MAKRDILAKKLFDFQVDINMAIAQGILDLNHKEKLLFKCTRSKNFTFSTIKTLVKALYIFRGKNNIFNPSYRKLTSIGLSSPI